MLVVRGWRRERRRIHSGAVHRPDGHWGCRWRVKRANKDCADGNRRHRERGHSDAWITQTLDHIWLGLVGHGFLSLPHRNDH
jgi:hypothetical protein